MAALYFDLETVPDYARLAQFGLPEIPPPPAEFIALNLEDVEDAQGKRIRVLHGKNECMPINLHGFFDASVKIITERLKKLHPDENTRVTLAAFERVNQNRAGVLDAIASCGRARQAAIDAYTDRHKLLSTTPEYCRIVALGYAVGDAPPQALLNCDVSGTYGYELDILDAFWALVAEHEPLIGFNVLHFDLPVLFTRSALAGIPPTRLLDMKPWGRDVIDLYAIRFGSRGAQGDGRPGKLKDLMRVMGIPCEAEGVDGSQTEELATTNPKRLAEYVMSDVAGTRDLHRKLRGYWWA